MKNQKIAITIILCISLVLTFTILVSYAYWKVQKVQTGTNDVLGACLSIELTEIDSNGFTLDNAWPVTDEEGLSQNGYHFTVRNTCEEAVTYQIVLDSLDTGNNMDYQYVKVSIDNGNINRYGELALASTEGATTDPLDSRVVYTGQIPGSKNNTIGEVEHTLKLWISEDSPNTEIGKEFDSKVRVIVGQGLPTQEYAITPGECFDFDESTGTITGYDEENCTTDYLVVPQKINGVIVKNIYFYNYTDQSIAWNYVDLTNATGLETIGGNAFCLYVGTNEELIIPDSVKTIEKYAFNNYNGPKLTLGNSVETIGEGAFFSYNGSKLTLGNSVETIGKDAFASYNGSKLTLGNSVETIGHSAFYSYVGANEKLVIPDSVKTIEDQSFYYYNGSNLTLGNSVETIGRNAFQSYVGTNQELIIPDSVETIGESAFWVYVGTKQELIIPNNVKTIGTSAFYYYNGTKLTLGNNVETIGGWAFWRYNGTIYVNMTESDFNNVTKGEDWHQLSSGIVYLQ